jgi:putative Holliday junction resolvase
MNGRLIGLDVGEKRIGVAVSDGLGMTAQPVGGVERKSLDKDAARILELLAEYDIDCAVAGLPLQMNGEEGEQAARVRHFCNAFSKRTEIEVIYQDERLTSAQSERMLIDSGVRRGKRRQVIDKMAATLILQSYMDSHPNSSGPRS